MKQKLRIPSVFCELNWGNPPWPSEIHCRAGPSVNTEAVPASCSTREHHQSVANLASRQTYLFLKAHAAKLDLKFTCGLVAYICIIPKIDTSVRLPNPNILQMNTPNIIPKALRHLAISYKKHRKLCLTYTIFFFINFRNKMVYNISL